MGKKYTYYGIDVSQSSLQISYQSLQGTWQETEIANQIIAISEWLQNIDLTQSWFIYEYTGNYSSRLSYALNLVEAQFSILTPSQSKGFRATLKSISKTDKQDARMLCQYGQKMQPEATALPDVSLEQKRQKYKYLATLKAEKQAFTNRLDALSYLPNADKIVQNSLQETITFFDLQIQTLSAEVFTLDEDDFKRIYDLMTQVVGIGNTTATALIIATNGFQDFDNAKQVAKFIGVAPSDRQSGTSIKQKGHISKSACAAVRTSLYMAAQNAARFNHACKELFTRLRAKGKPYKLVIIAVINKLIKQTFAVVKNKATFDNFLINAK
jgi:transposase